MLRTEDVLKSRALKFAADCLADDAPTMEESAVGELAQEAGLFGVGWWHKVKEIAWSIQKVDGIAVSTFAH